MRLAVVQHQLPVAHVDPLAKLEADLVELRHLAKAEAFVMVVVAT